MISCANYFILELGWNEAACKQWEAGNSGIQHSKHGSLHSKSVCFGWEQVTGGDSIHPWLSLGSFIRLYFVVYCFCYEKTKPISISYWEEEDATCGKSAPNLTKHSDHQVNIGLLEMTVGQVTPFRFSPTPQLFNLFPSLTFEETISIKVYFFKR